ncbi:LamG-like jellyroll fold domain-containing protein [Streptosporangium sp. NPDC004631]
MRKSRKPSSGRAFIAAFGLATSLVATLPAVAEPSPTPKQSRPTQATSPTDIAKAEAKRLGKEVEISSLNTENMTTVARPGGKSLGTYVYSTPIRFKNKSGAWHAIDTALVQDGAVITPKAVKGEVRLSAGGDTELLTVKTPQGRARLAAPVKLPQPTLADNTATYTNAYGDGIDMVVQVTPTGIQHKIVITQRPAKPLAFRVPIDAGDGLQYRARSGHAEVLDDGKKVADVTPALMLDAKAAQSVTAGRIRSVDTKLDGADLLYTPDVAFLADPATSYPVTLVGNPTPWYGAGFPTDTFVSTDTRFSVGSAQQYMDAILAGRNNFDGSTSTHYIYRSYLKYDLSNAPWYGLPILNADIRPWNYITTHCGGDVDTPKMVVRRVTSDWALNASSAVDLRWNQQPSVTTWGEAIKGGGVGRIMKRDGSYINCGAPSQELYYSIEGIVRDWANGAPNYGLQIAANGDSVGGSNYREYLSSEWAGVGGRGPVMFVEYEAPEQPIGAAGWFLPSEPGITDVNVAKAIDANPALGRAGDTLPVASDVTDTQAVNEKDNSTEQFEVSPGDLIDENPEVDNPAPDTTSPIVLETDPVNSATSVAVSEVYVLFDEEVTGVQVALKNSLGSSIPGSVSAGPTQTGWSFRSQQPLVSGMYTAEVSGARDRAGNSMASAYTWSFTIGNAPSDGLVAAYGMEEGVGFTVADTSGNNNTGTAGAVTWVSGKYGNALSFGGAGGSWVTVPHSTSLRLSTGMTLSAWVNPSAADGYRTVLMKDHANGSAYGLYASNGTAPSGWALKPDAIGHNIVNGVSTLPLNTWSHVAVTYDGTVIRLYVNGNEAGQVAATGNLIDDGGALHLGGDTKWGEYFSGLIDEVRIYDRAQTTAQIQTDMATPVTTRPLASRVPVAAPGLPAPVNVPPNAANIFDRMTPGKCAERESLAGRPQGWVMNHFSWCQMGRVEAYWQSGRCMGGTPCIPEPAQYFIADVMLIGYTFNGLAGLDRSKGDTARDTVVEAYLYNNRTSGTMPPGKKMTLTVDIGNKNRCDVVASRGGQAISNYRTDLISNWILDGHATFRFRCDPRKAPVYRVNEWVTRTTVRNDERVSITTIRASVNFPDWPNTRWRFLTSLEKNVVGNVIRCDSASYIAFSAGGCIFYKTKPAVKWTYTAISKNGNRVWQFKQAFQHYWNACTHPDTQTYPDKPGKNIFGCDVNGNPVFLHRESKAQRDVNQGDTNARCNRMWPGYANSNDPNPANWKQCDEFPFASTMERSIAPLHRDLSLCPIIAQHNGDAGLYLARFYNADRVLIGDQFTNRFDTMQNDPISREGLCGIPTNPQ